MELVMQWGPVLIKAIPEIMRVAEGLNRIWSLVTKTKKENDAVLQGMKLLSTHKDDIDRLLEDPEKKKQLMEGLEILMSKIWEKNASQAFESPRQVHSSQTICDPDIKSNTEHYKGGRGLCCGVCTGRFDTRQQRPLLLPKCGHTFCKSCLEKISRRELLCCPTCHSYPDVAIDKLPTNMVILGLLSKDADYDECEKWNGNSVRNPMMSYEDMIRYAIFLSLEEMACQERETTCSQMQKHQEEEDLSLQMALDLQEREIKWAARSGMDEEFLRSWVYQSKSAPLANGCNTNYSVESGHAGDDYNCVRDYPLTGADIHGAYSTEAETCSMHADCINNESCSFDNEEIDDSICKNESCSCIDCDGSQGQNNSMPLKDGEENMKNCFIGQQSPQEGHQTAFNSLETCEDEDKYEEVEQFESSKRGNEHQWRELKEQFESSKRGKKHQWRELKEQEELNVALALSLSLQDHEQKDDFSHS